METSSGKDTLHDTIGILYQNVVDRNEADSSEESRDNTSSTNDESTSCKRRTLDVVVTELISYNKTTKLRENLLPVDSSLREIQAANLISWKDWIFYGFFRIIVKCLILPCGSGLIV